MKNSYYECIIVVIASRSEIYDKFINNYWKYLIKYIKEHNYKIKIFMIFGNNVNIDDLNIDEDDKLILNTTESYNPGILLKTLMAFKYIEENYEYKHIFRTNLSSFLIINNLLTISKQLDNKNVYAGFNGCYADIIFVSGSGFWLSRDNIIFLLETHINNTIIDDVDIGYIFKLKKKIILNRYDICNNINIINKNELLNNIIKDGHYHIRIKNDDRNIDIDYITEFTKILYIGNCSA